MQVTIEVIIVNGVRKGGTAAIGADAKVRRVSATDTEIDLVRNVESSKLDTSELSHSINTLAGLYSLLHTSLSFILSVSSKALITREFLA